MIKTGDFVSILSHGHQNWPVPSPSPPVVYPSSLMEDQPSYWSRVSIISVNMGDLNAIIDDVIFRVMPPQQLTHKTPHFYLVFATRWSPWGTYQSHLRDFSPPPPSSQSWTDPLSSWESLEPMGCVVRVENNLQTTNPMKSPTSG